MSRNKDIKFMHQVSGWSYKTCRQKMKEHHWDLWSALGYDEALQYLVNRFPQLCKEVADSIQNMVEYAVDAMNNFADAIKNIDLSPIDIKPIGEKTES